MSVKITKLDRIFRECVYEAWEHTCQKCGLIGRVDCAHFKSRRYTTACLRWAPANTLALCRACHYYVDSHPDEKYHLWLRFLGESGMQDLRDAYNHGRKVPRSEHKRIEAHYRAELERLRRLRFDGITGPIALNPYE